MGYGAVTIQPLETTPGEQKVLETPKMALADGVIYGQALDPDGKPAAAVTVSSQVQDKPEALTDAQGHFHLAGVPRGKHPIIASQSNCFGPVAEATAGQTDVVIHLKPEAKPVRNLVPLHAWAKMIPS